MHRHFCWTEYGIWGQVWGKNSTSAPIWRLPKLGPTGPWLQENFPGQQKQPNKLVDKTSSCHGTRNNFFAVVNHTNQGPLALYFLLFTHAISSIPLSMAVFIQHRDSNPLLSLPSSLTAPYQHPLVVNSLKWTGFCFGDLIVEIIDSGIDSLS